LILSCKGAGAVGSSVVPPCHKGAML
jgi:hypothetical protein